MPHLVTFDSVTISGRHTNQVHTGIGAINDDDPLTGIDTGSGNDHLTGIDTGSGNDHLTGNDMWSPAPGCTYTSEPGGHDHIVHHVGSTSGPGGTSYMTGENGKAIVHPSFQPEADGYTEVEWTYLTENVSGTSGPGGTSFLTGYAEAVGLDSSTVDVVNNLNSICGGCGRHGTPWQADV